MKTVVLLALGLALGGCEQPVPMATKSCQGTRADIADAYLQRALPARGVAYELCGRGAHGPVCQRTNVDLRAATVTRESTGSADDLADAALAGTTALSPDALQELISMLPEIRAGSAPTDREVTGARFQFGVSDGDTICYVDQHVPPPPGHVIARFMARVATFTQRD